MRERIDLFIRQGLGCRRHGVAGPVAVAEILQLLDQVGILLSGNARKFVEALVAGLVAGDALRFRR